MKTNPLRRQLLAIRLEKRIGPLLEKYEPMKPIRAGDYVHNLQTGESRLVVCVDPHDETLLFARASKWESARNWVGNVRPSDSESVANTTINSEGSERSEG